MKTRMFVSILILVLAVLIVAGSCAKEKPDYISKEYEIYGTWVNPEYDNSMNHKPKVVINPNGIMDTYNASTAPKPGPLQRKFFITNKWTESKGTIWYTFIVYVTTEELYSLAKISNSGKTLEWFMSTDYPKEMDPESTQYRFYNRQ